MYEDYWQLQSRPFDDVTDPRGYYPSEVHQGALLKLRYALENRRGAALLCGASGTGKTMLVNMLRRQLPESCAPLSHVVFPQLTPRELVAYLADELGAPGAASNGALDEDLRRLQRFLSDNAARGRQAVLAIDEAHLLVENGLLDTVRLLLNFEVDGRAVWTLLLIGQPTLLPVVERMTAFEDRLAVKCLLRQLTLDETISYVSHRLMAAGAKREIFTQDALMALHQLTGGSPRRINRICDLALLIGFAEELRNLSASHIEAVSNELVTVSPD
jgi:type II secretory pathway predicted ATPase ExeA